MPKQLTDIVINEISLVDEGANDDARVVIVKRKDDDTMTLHEFTEALEATGDKLAAIERHVEETEVEVAKARELIAAKDAEILKLTDPDVMLKAKAVSVREANPRLTAEQAYAQAVEQNPDLYTAYVRKRQAPLATAEIAKLRSSNPEGLLMAKAVEIHKANPSLTEAQAYSQAVDRNPDLYRDYVAKRRLA